MAVGANWARRIAVSLAVLATIDTTFTDDPCAYVRTLATAINAAAELHRLDPQLIESIVTPHPSGLKVLAAPLEPAFADDITTAGLMQMLDLLQESYDYVVVDTASMLDELEERGGTRLRPPPALPPRPLVTGARGSMAPPEVRSPRGDAGSPAA